MNLKNFVNKLNETKYNKLFSNKVVFFMVVINLIFHSMKYIQNAIDIKSLDSGLIIIILLMELIFLNFFLFLNIILSIINIKKTKMECLILIPIFADFTLFFSMKFMYYEDLFEWLHIIQTILLNILMIVKIFMFIFNGIKEKGK